MAINLSLIVDSLPFLLAGARAALIVTLWSVTLGAVIGLVVAMGRLSGNFALRWLASVYVEFLRGTPLVVQIFIIYFGLPNLGIDLPPFVAGVTALGMNSGAYMAEIYRAGIQSIDIGQTQAALSLGMRPLQVFRHVVLPQALIRVLPAMGNEFITMIKESSLVSFIAVQELTYRSTLVAARTYDYFSMYMASALIYFAMTYITSRLLLVLERRLRPGD